MRGTEEGMISRCKGRRGIQDDLPTISFASFISVRK